MYPIDEDVALTTSKTEYVKSFAAKMKLVHATHRTNLEQDQTVMKEKHDRNVHVCHYKVGDCVYKRDDSFQATVRRFQRKFQGPYEILFFVDEGYSVILKNLTTGKTVKNKIHVNLLKLYLAPLTETEMTHLRKENEVGIESVPMGARLILVDADTQTSLCPSAPSAESSIPQLLADTKPKAADAPSIVPPGVDSTLRQPLPCPPRGVTDTADLQGAGAASLPRPKLGGRTARGTCPGDAHVNSKHDQSGEFKEILDDRYDHGTREYLVNKFSNKLSGEIFRPEWISDARCPIELLRNYRRKDSPVPQVREKRYDLRQQSKV